MDVSEFVLNYLIKESGADVSVPLDEFDRFQLYGELIKTVDMKNAGNTYLHSEEIYLRSHLLKNDIITVADIPQNITAMAVNQALCRADALLNNITASDSEVFLYGGTALKKQCAENKDKPFL